MEEPDDTDLAELAQLNIDQEHALIDPEAIEDEPLNATHEARAAQTNPLVQDSASDDLIPADDPSHHNLQLRNLAVDMLRRITARTVLAFVLSLLDGEDPAALFQDQDTRHSIVRSLQKNRDSFARLSRSETQLIVGESLLSARASILAEYENEPAAEESPDCTETDPAGRRRTLEERLEEKSVSSLVEAQLTELIKTQFTQYQHPFRNPLTNHPLNSSISLPDAAALISFSAQVSSWNRFFDLLICPP
ncbi:hypothetical protein PCANC_10699 [Puccinia coronata f. sp. avenae]|uniref:Uncharacterized protein n=1 Tax=Puccinia coronata f. sp. avenae TaxID=200324 RepID=A0A2N5UU36_9BASI|nr:hypothetical protein PCASD_10876 [Puccinia coronata f. sp. avenae]PLW48982.1 hypothetical protein PCANC_10699 [Puccinia coronata f. sp. avenae]